MQSLECAVRNAVRAQSGQSQSTQLQVLKSIIKTIKSSATTDKMVSNFGVRWSYGPLYLLALVFSYLYGKKYDT